MNDLNDIVFNPETGLFESRTNVTAHLTDRQIRANNRHRHTMDPVRAALKPVVVEFRVEGGNEHKVDTEVCVHWRVTNAQKVSIHFHKSRELEYNLCGTLRFVMPNLDCKICLVAKNGNVTSQRTITVKRIRKSIFERLFNR